MKNIMRLLLCAALLVCLPLHADDTGWLTATSATNIVRSGNNWTITGGAGSVFCDSGEESNWFAASGFGATVPSGASINGIEVRFTGNIDDSDGGYGQMQGMQLILSGSLTGTGKTNLWSDWPSLETRGSSSDLWGASVDHADVNSVSFGVAVWGAETDDFGDGVDLEVISIEIKIHYTPGPGGGEGEGEGEGEATGWWMFFG